MKTSDSITPEHLYSKALLAAYTSPKKYLEIACRDQTEARSLRFRFLNFFKKLQREREKARTVYRPELFAAADLFTISVDKTTVIIQPRSNSDALKSLKSALENIETPAERPQSYMESNPPSTQLEAARSFEQFLKGKEANSTDSND